MMMIMIIMMMCVNPHTCLYSSRFLLQTNKHQTNICNLCHDIDDDVSGGVENDNYLLCDIVILCENDNYL